MKRKYISAKLLIRAYHFVISCVGMYVVYKFVHAYSMYVNKIFNGGLGADYMESFHPGLTYGPVNRAEIL